MQHQGGKIKKKKKLLVITITPHHNVKYQISIEQMSFDEKIYSLNKIENFSKFKKPIEIKKKYLRT
jgi:hypothetical protein